MPHPLKKNILIVGGGFSGLTLAALLQKKDIFNIVVFEKDSAGGVLQSETFENVLIEHAAPSLLNHHLLESFVQAYGADLVPALKSSSRRYLFYDHLSRWPLGVFESLQFAFRALKFFFCKDKSGTLKEMTIEAWALRHLGPAFTDKVLRPALFGIYASDIRDLSAELVLTRFFDKTIPKNRARLKGSVIPSGGLTNFLKLLRTELVKSEVQFIKKKIDFDELLRLREDYIVIFATSFTDFLALVKKNPALFLELPAPADVQSWLAASARVTLISLLKVHLFFTEAKNRINGFGALFHPKNSFHALGVIANSNVFADYGPTYNEAWILKDEDEAGALVNVLTDRKRLFGSEDQVRASFVKKHTAVYPVYNTQLQQWLSLTGFQKGCYGTGNFWGALGLTQIFLYNINLTEKITSETQQ